MSQPIPKTYIFQNLSDYKLEWAEKQGKRQVADVPVQFIHVSSPYDDESTAHSFTLSLNPSGTPEVKIKMAKNDKGDSVTEKTYVKKGQVKQTVKKLCFGSTEAYLKWKRQLNHIIKSKLCKPSNVNLDMAETMFYGDFIESWKLWRQTEGALEVEKKFRERETRMEILEEISQG